MKCNTFKMSHMKEKELKHTKLKWMIISAVALVVVGIVLILCGLFIPPMGEIHPSVLTALGEVFTFSGSLWGLNTHYRIKTDQIDADLEIKQKENKKS